MPLDKQAAAWLKADAQAGLAPLNEMTVAGAREAYAAAVAEAGIAPEPVDDIVDRTIPGPGGDLPIRVYTPKGSGPFAILVYFHGGGWVLGDLDTVDGPCTVLANRAHAVVVSVDYRLAPEHTFPAAVEDCYAAIQWVADNAAIINGDPERLGVAGDDSGGALAAVVSVMARDQGLPKLMLQLLITPVADFNFQTASYLENGSDYFLTTDLMKWFFGHYLTNDDEGRDWRVSPLRLTDASGLPPAHVITAEFDPLRDEGEAYAALLENEGVTVTVQRYPGQIHAFTANLAGVMDQGKQSLEDAALLVRQVFRVGWQPRLWLSESR